MAFSQFLAVGCGRCLDSGVSGHHVEQLIYSNQNTSFFASSTVSTMLDLALGDYNLHHKFLLLKRCLTPICLLDICRKKVKRNEC